MRNPYLILILCLLALGGSFLVLSCGEETDLNGNGTVTSLDVSPSSATVEVGAAQAFSATAHHSDGTTSNPSASWSLSGGIGTLTSVGLNGLFTATATGEGTVEAAYAGFTASAAVTVVATGEIVPTGEALATIEVSPAQALLRVGETQAFSAAGTNASAESVAIAPSWEVSGEATGTLSFSGTTATFEATGEGTVLVTAVSGEVRGTAHLTVEGFTAEITAEADTYVDSTDGSPQGTSITLIAGRITDPSEKIYEAYIKFDLSFLPAGATVEAARLKLYASDTDGAAMKLGRIGSVWTDATTWETRPTIEAYIKNHTFSVGANEIEFKETVQLWADGTNEGVALYKDAPAVGYVNLVSRDDVSVEERRPRLYLEYIVP